MLTQKYRCTVSAQESMQMDSDSSASDASTRALKRAVFSIGAPYAGLVLAAAILGALSTPEYHHVVYLEYGLVGLAWSMVAIAGLVVSVITVRRSGHLLDGGIHWLVAVLQGPVVIAAAVLVPLSIACLNAYQAGFAAYDAAVRSCGGPPVLAWGGWGAHITLPTNSDYDRLKYETKDFLLLGPPAVYFCSAADAEAHGYPMIS